MHYWFILTDYKLHLSLNKQILNTFLRKQAIKWGIHLTLCAFSFSFETTVSFLSHHAADENGAFWNNSYVELGAYTLQKLYFNALEQDRNGIEMHIHSSSLFIENKTYSCNLQWIIELLILGAVALSIVWYNIYSNIYQLCIVIDKML